MSSDCSFIFKEQIDELCRSSALTFSNKVNEHVGVWRDSLHLNRLLELLLETFSWILNICIMHTLTTCLLHARLHLYLSLFLFFLIKTFLYHSGSSPLVLTLASGTFSTQAPSTSSSALQPPCHFSDPRFLPKCLLHKPPFTGDSHILLYQF